VQAAAVLDYSRALPQRDGRVRPAFAGNESARSGHLHPTAASGPFPAGG